MIKWLCYKIFNTGRSYSYDIEECGALPAVVDDFTPTMDRAVRFSILPARGGCVFEIRTHDQKTRDWNITTHVIPEGTDVATEVGRIVAMEMLRH